MKRSEMIDKLQHIIDDIYTVQNIESLYPNELAEMLLEEIEKVGMLPPNIDGDRYYHCYECGGDTVFMWEPEDEKK